MPRCAATRRLQPSVVWFARRLVVRASLRSASARRSVGPLAIQFRPGWPRHAGGAVRLRSGNQLAESQLPTPRLHAEGPARTTRSRLHPLPPDPESRTAKRFGRLSTRGRELDRIAAAEARLVGDDLIGLPQLADHHSRRSAAHTRNRGATW